jgi:hypothetical protein
MSNVNILAMLYLPKTLEEQKPELDCLDSRANNNSKLKVALVTSLIDFRAGDTSGRMIW